MRTLCTTFRSIFPYPPPSHHHPSFPPSPPSDSLSPLPPAFQPLRRSLSLDRSSLQSLPSHAFPGHHPPRDDLDFTPPPKPLICPADTVPRDVGFPPQIANDGSRQPQPPQFLIHHEQRDVSIVKTLSSANRFSASSPDEDDGSVALQILCTGHECISACNNASADRAVEIAPAPKSLATRRKIKLSPDEDDGSVAWRLLGSGRECISACNNSSADRAVEMAPAPKSFATRRKIKLHQCTEELGSESSGAQEEATSFDSLCESQSLTTISELKWKGSESLVQHRETVQPVLAKEIKLRSLGHKRKFPPPLPAYTSACGSPDIPPSQFSSLSLCPYRKNGRFILKEVEMLGRREYLRASRKDGRLMLELVSQTYNENFATPQSCPIDDFLGEDANSLDITSPGDEWQVTQASTDSVLSMENMQDDIEETKESESQLRMIRSMLPIPKKSKSFVAETSSSLGLLDEKPPSGVPFENDRQAIDSPIHSASLNGSKRWLAELHQAKSLPCLGYKLFAPLIKTDPLSSSNHSVLNCSGNPQTLGCSEINSLALFSGKSCRASNANSSGKNLLPACSLIGRGFPPNDKMKKTISGPRRLEEGSKLLKSVGSEGGYGLEERIGNRKAGVSFEGARSLPSSETWDWQPSFAERCAALRRQDWLFAVPCKEIENSELYKCLKLHLVATSS